MSARKENRQEKSPLRLLIWTAVAGLVFGLIGFGEIAEDWLRVARNKLHTHEASGDIVLVAVDDRSLRDVGRWPWPRRRHAELTDALTNAGARRIFFDLGFHGPSEPADDQLFADALERSGRVVLPVKSRFGPDAGSAQDGLPLPLFADKVELGAISAFYNYQNAIWWLPYANIVYGKPLQSFAAQMAEVEAKGESRFLVDYSVDPKSVPIVSAADVLSGSFDPQTVRGKQVIIGWTSGVLRDQFFVPGTGKIGGVYVQIIGAETLKAGRPIYLGWFLPFVLTLAIAGIALLRDGRMSKPALLGGTAILLLLGPALLEANLISLDITPALFVLLVIGCAAGWQRFRARGFVNSVSGLPNLSALRSNRTGRDQALIAARILNYAEIASALPPDSERQLVEQIVGRLKVGAPDRVLYQGDDGIFAWFEDPRTPFGHHLEALYALFRNPARVAGQQLDLAISFGVEIGSGRSLGNRLGSALVAAEKAAHDGLKWKYHDPDTLQDASWKLSMLSQLDEAVEKGEVWVAFQPKLDLGSRTIIGAEALARWTHPEKGPIAASEFIAAAEAHDRIGKLTDFVLEQAIAGAARINRQQPGFSMAVNLSARLLTDKGFLLRLSAMLARHRLQPQLLTLELTETATLAGDGSSLDMLVALRDLGVTISIDDYGTGFSTLDYLKKVPASEIKIDQSFIKSMLDNRSDRLMVHSTIGLAHSLGRKVVAEGVERRETLEALSEMGCDIAQGFIIGRPLSLESLTKRVGVTRKQRPA